MAGKQTKPRNLTGKKLGRPKKYFTDEQLETIETMAHNNCNTQTIAECAGVDKDVLVRNLGRKLIHWRSEGKRDLSALQHRLATASPQMAIFLGKNYLGQTDRQDIRTSTAVPEISPEKRKEMEQIAREYKLRLSKEL